MFVSGSQVAQDQISHPTPLRPHLRSQCNAHSHGQKHEKQGRAGKEAVHRKAPGKQSEKGRQQTHDDRCREIQKCQSLPSVRAQKESVSSDPDQKVGNCDADEAGRGAEDPAPIPALEAAEGNEKRHQGLIPTPILKEGSAVP